MFRTAFARIAAVLFIAFPAIASAHAIPVDSSPESSAILQNAPSAISITFSEHIDDAASSIEVTGPSGESLDAASAKTDRSNTHILSVPVKDGGTGTYVVKWSSVSSDDGHFTRGSYAFAVGAGQTISPTVTSQDTEIVELSTTPEAIASGFELAGHGLLWAVLLLFAFAIRPLLRSGRYESEARIIRRGYALFLSLGVLLAFFGGVAQIMIKAAQLASLRSIEFAPALSIYLSTDAGLATAVRIGAVVVILAAFVIGRRWIFGARKISIPEIAMFGSLLCFAFFRAKISHATSNPFHPDLSIAVNFLHVIEKDVWAGIAGILFAIALMPSMRRLLAALMSRAFAMLAIDFALVSVTASYIIWLHLKSFGNLFTTQWGTTLLQLLIPAILVVAMRTYHVISRLYAQRFFARFFTVTIALECAFALLVVYCSSVVIITSPPLSATPQAFTVSDQGASISIARDAIEDGMVEIALSGANIASSTPVATAQAPGEDPVSLTLQKRFDGGYVFPSALLSGQGPFTVSLTVPQSGAYDAHAIFQLTRADLVPPPEGARSVDLFTIVMTVIALAALIYGIFLYRLSRQSTPEIEFGYRRIAGSGALALAFAVCALCIVLLGRSALSNPFRAACVADGNEWHVMLPSIAGVPTSKTPAEGCMWGMGQYMYMFADKREYDFESHLGNATGTLALSPTQPVAGRPVEITVSLKKCGWHTGAALRRHGKAHARGHCEQGRERLCAHSCR